MNKIIFSSVLLFICVRPYSQCLQDRHNTSRDAHWISCESQENPNQLRNPGHWIMYEFEDLASIQEIKIWNVNHPDDLDIGIRELAVDYSMDGINWQSIGTFNLNMGTGSSLYEGQTLSEIEAFESRFILLTTLSNYGSNCFGLGEVRFSLNGLTTATLEESSQPVVQTYPNPLSDIMTVKINDLPTGSLTYKIIDSYGRLILRKNITQNNGYLQFDIDGSAWSSGFYFLNIITPSGSMTTKISVVHPD